MSTSTAFSRKSHRQAWGKGFLYLKVFVFRADLGTSICRQSLWTGDVMWTQPRTSRYTYIQILLLPSVSAKIWILIDCQKQRQKTQQLQGFNCCLRNLERGSMTKHAWHHAVISIMQLLAFFPWGLRFLFMQSMHHTHKEGLSDLLFHCEWMIRAQPLPDLALQGNLTNNPFNGDDANATSLPAPNAPSHDGANSTGICNSDVPSDSTLNRSASSSIYVSKLIWASPPE